MLSYFSTDSTLTLAGGLILLAIYSNHSWANTPNVLDAPPNEYLIDGPVDNAAIRSAIARMSPEQRRSYYLLLHNYPECFYIDLESVVDSTKDTTMPFRPNVIPSTHFDITTPQSVSYDLPIEYSITLYEKHNAYCGGDPDTMPRRATYYIDKYGRIFKDNVIESTLDLQYRFGERGVMVEDLSRFIHPTGVVFNKYHVPLTKVEKRANDTFVIFYVSKLPDTILERLFKDVLIANGRWDYMLRTEDGDAYFIEGSNRKIIDSVSFK